jgi:NAD(P)-dependent dehydrogenase (short-subunit alcohol dehydrogenase family)
MGAVVFITGRDKARLNETMKALSAKDCREFICDLADEKQTDKLIEEMPLLDGLVHCAGIVRPFPVKFIGRKQIDEMYAVNYNSPVLLTSKLFKSKKISNGASIVFMSSISSRFAHKGGALYSGTKAGLESFSKTIAIEYAVKRIRSNCISAAMVKTPLFDEAEKAVTKEMMDEHGSKYPLGFGEPADVASAIVFLLSDASRWNTGTSIVMDGGLSAGQ